MIDTHLPRPPCPSLVVPISRLYPVIISDVCDSRIALPAKLIHKSNEVIGRDLEFGIETMAREYDEDAGRKRGR